MRPSARTEVLEPRTPTVRGNVLLLAAPLSARSGVYRSTLETIEEARARGLPWRALVGVRRSAGAGGGQAHNGVTEFCLRGAGYRRRRREIAAHVRRELDARPADLVVSLVPQSDVLLRRLAPALCVPWVAFVRGQPWPGAGEAALVRRVLWRLAELRALRSADEVWATTEVLQRVVAPRVRAYLVPAGIKVPGGERAQGGDVVWSGRYDVDKNPDLFLEVVRGVRVRAAMFGHGPLEAGLRARAPDNVEVHGWTPAEVVRARTSILVGTSVREGFGRSAVEAAACGCPVVISDRYGAAPLLFTDPGLARLCVLPVAQPELWTQTLTALLEDPALATHIARHVQANSRSLTISGSVDVMAGRVHRRLAGSTS